MKKLSFLVVLVMISLSALAQTTVKLPSPDKQVAMTLYEALQTRHSVRSYQNKDVDNATLAQVLWAACGYSREAEKKITAASALNRQDIEVYVIKAAGAYRYDVESNALVQLSGKDLRREVAAGSSRWLRLPSCLCSPATKASSAPWATLRQPSVWARWMQDMCRRTSIWHVRR